MTPMPALIDFEYRCRFYQYLDKPEGTDCWFWTGCHRNGRPSIKLEGKMYFVSRVSYWLHTGKDPGEFLVCHECNDESCCNPEHLFLGTQSDNMQHRVDSGNHNCVPPIRNTLDETEVLDIRHSKLLNKELAEIHKVSTSTISRIQAGHTWRHIK